MIISHRTWLFLMLSILAVASMLLSLLHGSTVISAQQFFHTLSGSGDELTRQIIFQLRIPRTCAAFVTGGLLALAGAMMQVLLRNPLADPYVLGISGGAAVMSLLGILSGLSGYWLTGGAWLGSFFAMLCVLALSKRKSGWYTQSMLLTGIALASGFAALISFILLVSPNAELHSMLFWLLGDLSYAHMPILEAGILLLGLILGMGLGKPLNILVRGEQNAKALGIHPERLKLQLYLLSSLFTATAVALAGCIGFVGLLVPHMLRLLWGSDHRYLLPGSVLLGGSLLTIADTVSRIAFTPQQLPVGIVMTLIGVPVFLVLLRR